MDLPLETSAAAAVTNRRSVGQTMGYLATGGQLQY
jgi:hypothetical protein